MSNVQFTKGTSSNIVHAFFKRWGGVSPEPYDELNVAKHVADKPANVDTNRLRALQAINVVPEHFVFLGRLEHSNRIELVDGSAGGLEIADHDALITSTPGLAIGLSVADCLPIILVDEEQPALGLVHAGWRGLKVEVIRHTVEAMQQHLSAQPDRLKAIIGPSIGPLSYEVGRDVAELFDTRYLIEDGGEMHLDMWSLAHDQLAASAVRHIENVHIDTFTNTDFYSARRQKGETGRFLAVASL